MPKIVLPVVGTNESITRPIVLDVTRQLFKITGLPEDTSIFYPGDTGSTKQPGSEFAQEAGVNTMPFSNRLSVEVEENFDADRILSMAVYRPENLYIFKDDAIETYIKPAYSNTDIVINFRYRAVDKDSAIRWRDDMRTRVAMARDLLLHDISYHYLVPPEFLVILKELHRMREAVAGYNEAYDDYFKNNTTVRASVLTTLAGTQGSWGISETQRRILGYFDFEGVPELGSSEDENKTWTISFSYKFKYDKPVACTMFYPLVIHNQLVDQKFRPNLETDTDALDRHLFKYSLSAGNFANFETGNNAPNTMPGVAIPSFDEFLPSSVPNSTKRVFTAMVNIDTTNPSFLLSMKDLGPNNVLNPAILKFMVGEAPYMLKYCKSIFMLNLYRSIYLIEDTIAIDSDLNITAIKDLSLRQYYHLRLSVVTDLSLLDAAALLRLRNAGDALNLILEYIDSSLTDKGLIPSIMVGNYVAKKDLQLAIEEINRGYISDTDWQHRGRNTVQTLFISAYRRRDLPI